MMKTKRMPFTISGVHFKSNAALKRHVQAMVASVPDGQMMPSDDESFVAALVRERHPCADKVIPPGVPILGIRVLHESGKRLLGKGGGNHLLMVTAGGERPFAWSKCCTGFDDGEIARVAMRNAVADQVMAYKRSRFGGRFNADVNISCDATGEPVSWDTCHVDHHGLPFRDIVLSFLHGNGLTISDIQLEHLRTGGHVLADPTQAAAWAAWHQRNAKLRIVKRERNMSDGAHDGDVRPPSEKRGREIPTSGSASIDYIGMLPDEIAVAEAHVRIVIEQARAYAADLAGDAVAFTIACDRADEIGVELIRLKAIVQARLDAEESRGDGTTG
jgi:hypothetical protein